MSKPWMRNIMCDDPSCWYFSTVSSLHQASPLPGHEKPIRFPGRLVSVDVVDNVQVHLSSLSHTSMDFLAGEWWGTNAHAMCSWYLHSAFANAGLWSSFQALKTSQRMLVAGIRARTYFDYHLLAQSIALPKQINEAMKKYAPFAFVTQPMSIGLLSVWMSRNVWLG